MIDGRGRFASFAEKKRGTLTRGRLADVVLLDRDITRVAPETLAEARVVMTMAGGRVVHAAPDL